MLHPSHYTFFFNGKTFGFHVIVQLFFKILINSSWMTLVVLTRIFIVECNLFQKIYLRPLVAGRSHGMHEKEAGKESLWKTAIFKK